MKTLIRKMTKLIMRVKIAILPTLSRMNCQEPGLVIGRQVLRHCKYQTRGNGGLEWNNVKMKISEWS